MYELTWFKHLQLCCLLCCRQKQIAVSSVWARVFEFETILCIYCHLQPPKKHICYVNVLPTKIYQPWVNWPFEEGMRGFNHEQRLLLLASSSTDFSGFFLSTKNHTAKPAAKRTKRIAIATPADRAGVKKPGELDELDPEGWFFGKCEVINSETTTTSSWLQSRAKK